MAFCVCVLQGDMAQAAHYYRLMLKLREQQEISGPETQEALLFLANHCKEYAFFLL